MRMNLGQSLTVPQIAERFAVDPDCVRAWIKSGALVAIDVSRVKGKLPRWRVTPQALEQFEQARASNPGRLAKLPTRARRQRPADFIEYF